MLLRNWSRTRRGSYLRRRMILALGLWALDLVNRRELERFLVFFEPDAETTLHGFALDIPERYVGPEGMSQFFEDWTASMGWPQFTVERIVDFGDRMLLGMTFASRGLISGVPASKQGMGFIIDFSPRGLISGWHVYWDAREALRDCGLDAWP